MVNSHGEDLEADLAAANPVPEGSAGAILPPDVNEMILRRITESDRGTRPLLGANLARIGFLGVLASIALILVALNLSAGGDVDAVTPAIRATPVDVPQSTAGVLTVGPDTTLAAPPSSPQTTVPTTTERATTTAERVTSTTAQATTSTLPQVVVPVPDPDPDPQNEPVAKEGDEDEGQEDQPCTAEGRTQKRAIAAYREACSVPRVDCDPIEDYWLCSSSQIGDKSPKSS